MSLDTIQLSRSVCGILYARSMVEPAQNQAIKGAGLTREVRSLGENQKNVLVLVNNEETAFLGDDEMDLFTKLITACKLSMADIAMVNYHNYPLSYLELTSHFGAEKILSFGPTTSELGLPFTIPFFQIQSFNGQSYLPAPPLSRFLNNKELKTELWTSLRKLFMLSR